MPGLGAPRGADEPADRNEAEEQNGPKKQVAYVREGADDDAMAFEDFVDAEEKSGR